MAVFHCGAGAHKLRMKKRHAMKDVPLETL